MPNQDFLYDHLKANAKYATPKNVIHKGEGKGKHLVICGAGPSLADSHTELKQTKAHQVWAANSALTYLVEHDLPVTHGVTVDMSEDMFTDPREWQTTHPVKYLVSSGVHPDLIPRLLKDGRTIRLFHSYLGIHNPEGWLPPAHWTPPAEGMNTYEMYLYQTIYPPTVQVGYGLNTVPRAICLALWMEFKSITVFGADCACRPDQALMPQQDASGYLPWLESLQLYADGRTPAKYGPQAVMTQGILNGRTWHTRPDMIISAQHLVHMARAYPQLHLMGDTLPNALLTMPEDYLRTMPNLTGEGAVSGFGVNATLTPEGA
jgi:6-hydroxymethylpterin diphosphokinase MptE-like protein